MSTANGATIKSDKFLQHVSLKNYKSIKDVEIDFKPGLNVVIGKNGAGKTNFLSGLDIILKADFKKFIDSQISITALFENKKVEIEVLEQSSSVDDYFNPSPNILLKIDGKENDFNKFHDVVFYELARQGYMFSETFIKFGTHYNETSEFVRNPFTFVLSNSGKPSIEWTSTINNMDSKFVYSFFVSLYNDIIKTYFNESIDAKLVNILKKNIITFSEDGLEHINTFIGIYSPIKSIRINPDFNVIIEDQKQIIANFYLEFLINDNWLTYTLLSDGIKRLFYIISEILSIQLFTTVSNGREKLNIIFLEEPELGIHPHQLHQLMQFIKEQSKEKQIILTTHSPQVLDILEPDELDRIIICHYDAEKGTQLSHLTDQQIKKAKKYISSEAFLSDYWRFSDLEPA